MLRPGDDAVPRHAAGHDGGRGTLSRGISVRYCCNAALSAAAFGRLPTCLLAPFTITIETDPACTSRIIGVQASEEMLRLDACELRAIERHAQRAGSAAGGRSKGSGADVEALELPAAAPAYACAAAVYTGEPGRHLQVHGVPIPRDLC